MEPIQVNWLPRDAMNGGVVQSRGEGRTETTKRCCCPARRRGGRVLFFKWNMHQLDGTTTVYQNKAVGWRRTQESRVSMSGAAKQRRDERIDRRRRRAID